MKNEMNFLRIVCLLIAVLVTLSGCDLFTQTKKGTITGTIQLYGESGHSGVTVLLYKETALPHELSLFNSTNPYLAFNVGMKHTFDHRGMPPEASVLTNAAGSFSFSDINHGRYIVVAYKEGWGFRYMYDVVLHSGSLNITDQKEVILYETINVPLVNESTFTFESDKCYIITDNTYFLSGSIATIEAGATILISQGMKLTVLGTLLITETPGKDIRVTSFHGIYSTSISPEPGDSIELLPGSSVPRLSNLIVTHIMNGIVLRTSDLTIEKSFFSRGLYGINGLSIDSLYVNACVFYNNSYAGTQVLTLHDLNSFVCTNSAFIANTGNILLELTDNSIIRNNYFYGGAHLVQRYDSNALVEYNEFINGTTCIENSAKSNMTIRYNDIQGNYCVFLGPGAYNLVNQGWTKANFNNFDSGTWAVYARSLYVGVQDYYRLDFENNYWGTASQAAIDAMIWDFTDETAPFPTNSFHGLVDYLPFRTSSVANAGIQ